MMSDNWTKTGDCSTVKVSEFDIFEAFHNLESPTTWHSHSGALHRNTSSYCGMTDQAKANSWTNDVGFEEADSWHTYGRVSP